MNAVVEATGVLSAQIDSIVGEIDFDNQRLIKRLKLIQDQIAISQDLSQLEQHLKTLAETLSKATVRLDDYTDDIDSIKEQFSDSR